MIRTVSVQEKAETRIRAATYGAIEQANCEVLDGVLILRGRVRNFYSKQLAQEAVGKLPGVTDIVNQIEVVVAS